MSGRFGLEIRSATPADAPALSELMAAAGQPVAAGVLSVRLEALHDEAGVVLLALGWSPGGVIAISWSHTLMADTPSARATLLLVHPDERRRGIARLLLKAGAQAARAAGCDTLQVPAPQGRSDLEAFCRATGFVGSGLSFDRPLRKRL